MGSPYDDTPDTPARTAHLSRWKGASRGSPKTAPGTSELAEVFAGLHREHDVDLRFGVSVTQLVGAGAR